MPNIDPENTPPPEGTGVSPSAGRAPHAGQRLPHAFEGEVLRALLSIRGPKSLKIEALHEDANLPFRIRVEKREGDKFLLLCLTEGKVNPCGDQHDGCKVKVIHQHEWDRIKHPAAKTREVGRNLGMVFPDWS